MLTVFLASGSALYMHCFILVLPTALSSGDYYCAHFPAEETEAQVTRPVKVQAPNLTPDVPLGSLHSPKTVQSRKEISDTP